MKVVFSLAEGPRMLTHGRYLAFYRVEGDCVRIVRILHGARDIGQDDIGPTSTG